MNKDRQQFDVIIVGAGLAGSALAAALANSDLQVAVVEAQPLKTGYPPLQEGVADFDPRVSALTVASQNFLEQVGAWPAIAKQRISPYQHMHVWDGEGTAFIDFDADDINEPCLGHIVENRVTVAALLDCIRTASNVTVVDGVKLAELIEEGGSPAIELEDGRRLEAPLLVAADGAFSILRSKAGFHMREWEYGHSAIVTTVQMEYPHQATAWQRFMPEGPLAFLPLRTADNGQQMCSIVWSALSAYADNLMALDDEEFAERLEQALECRLGKVVQVGKRFSFPLCQRHATDYVKPGLALVADAAHTIHPLAGQGINIGLKDVAALSEEILRAYERGLNPGHASVLNRYQRRRKGDNLAVMLTMEGFKRLFAETALPVRWARNTGMRWINQATPLKNRLVRQAMGL
jgi:2-octaprenylphenol hydroxylase